MSNTTDIVAGSGLVTIPLDPSKGQTDLSKVVWYHGGPAGLQAGDFITPPYTRPPQHHHYLKPFFKDPLRDFRVYITPEPTFARCYASGAASFSPNGCGAVYRVKPFGRIEVDPNGTELATNPLRFQWCCIGARVLEVVEEKIANDQTDDMRKWETLAAGMQRRIEHELKPWIPAFALFGLLFSLLSEGQVPDNPPSSAAPALATQVLFGQQPLDPATPTQTS